MIQTLAGSRHDHAGLSLIEACLASGITALLMAQAVPAMRDMLLKQRLYGLSQTLMTDLQQARSEAVHRGQAVHMRFSTHAHGTCYLMHGGQPAQCQCTDGGGVTCADPSLLIKSEWVPSQRAVAIRANVAGLSFQPRQGAVTSTGSIDVISDKGWSIRQVVSIAGRVRSCSPLGTVQSVPPCA
jgi:Tfp pilus assembly protein FimT